MPTLLAVNNYHYYRGGSETVYLEQNRALSDLGWSIVPFAMKHPRNLETVWDEYFVERNEFDGDQSVLEKLNRIPSVVYSIEARQKLARLLLAVSPDVCHAHNIYHHISPSILGLLKTRGIPTVLTVHDLKIACPAYTMLTHDGICERCRGGRLYNVVIHRCIKQSAALSGVVMLEAILHRALGSYTRCVDRFIVPSRFHLDKLCDWGMPRSRFTHVPNFVDAARIRPQFLPGSAVVYFGRVSPEKGLATLIRAAAKAACPLRIVGTGPAMETMQRLAADCGADVSFPGYLSGERLHEAVRSARCVVLPSECYENAPMSLLESYALGKPVIGARIGGIPELIRDGETGFTFSSGDVDSLSEVLRSIAVRRDDDVETMGRAARQWVEQAFTVELYRARVLDVYRELGVNVYGKEIRGPAQGVTA